MAAHDQHEWAMCPWICSVVVVLLITYLCFLLRLHRLLVKAFARLWQKNKKSIQFFELNTGAKIPTVGLDTWLGDPARVGQTIETAIKLGYRHIDCAPSFGNEKEIGLTLKKLLENNVVKREDLWITSKLWHADHAPEDVPKALRKTLQDLQLDYLDLYLIHWPIRLKKGTNSSNPNNFIAPDIPSTWKAMESLYDTGKVRALGVCNFSTKKLSDLLAVARIKPSVVRVECHPKWQQKKLHKFCESNGIHLSAYWPLGSQGLSWIKERVVDLPVVKMVAKKMGKTPTQVLLRWALQMGHSVIFYNTNERRLRKNLDATNWRIPDKFMGKFDGVEQRKLLTGKFYVNETSGPYKTLNELWDGEI